jgi:LmbE family N-acetylglucosaminyl deacetylase
MNPYASLVAAYARAIPDGQAHPLGGVAPASNPSLSEGAPKALMFSPHPDDECIIGALPLRLRRQSAWNVINVAVTLGSAKARQRERWAELKGACDYMGFGLIQTAPNGLERVNLSCRREDPVHWATMVEVIARILLAEQPRAIFLPHENDWNATHIGVHFLVMDALKLTGNGFKTTLIETEYWHPMTEPNVMVEVSEEVLTDQMTGTSFHAGEVRRNPYHLLLPAWMQDNVRRGTELIGGMGGASPGFNFATLYRMRHWQDGARDAVSPNARTLAMSENAATLFV